MTAGANVGFYFGAARRNVAGTHGGAFAVPGGTLEIVGTNVVANEAGEHGGAGAVTLTGVVDAKGVWFRRNEASGRGGAWAVLAFDDTSNPRLTLDGDRDFEGCTGPGNVGFNEYCSELRNNHAADGGGAIYAEDGTTTIQKTALLSNDAGDQGTAILM